MEQKAVHNERVLSRKQTRERVRQERRRHDAELAARQLRNRRLTRLALTIGAAVVAVVAVVVLVSAAGNSSKGANGDIRSSVDGVSAVSSQFAGIPQADMALGNPRAPVTINEYGDLQCTACQAFASATLPSMIDKLVRTGKARIVFHNWPIIDQTESVTAAKASYAAARQRRAWQFIELFYRNQGTERSGYVTDSFLASLARAAGLDVARFNADRGTPAVTQRVQLDAQQALTHHFQGTPSFTVTGPRGTRIVPAGAAGDVQPFANAAQAVS